MLCFCHATTWITYKYTRFTSLWSRPRTSSLLPPLWVITERQLGLCCAAAPTGCPSDTWQHCALNPSHPFLPRCVHEPVLTSVSLLLCTQVHQCRFSSVHAHTSVSRVFFSLTPPYATSSGFIRPASADSHRPFSWLVSQGVSVPQSLYPSVCPCTRK